MILVCPCYKVESFHEALDEAVNDGLAKGDTDEAKMRQTLLVQSTH